MDIAAEFYLQDTPMGIGWQKVGLPSIADWTCSSYVPQAAADSVMNPKIINMKVLDPTQPVTFPRRIIVKSNRGMIPGNQGLPDFTYFGRSTFLTVNLTPVTQCVVNVPNPNIEHGTLTPSSATRNKASVHGTINCTGNARISVQTNGKNGLTPVPLKLSNGTTTDLKVVPDIAYTGNYLSVGKGITSFTIESTLTAPTLGYGNANAVVSISMQ
ncbi:hypothetical protein O4O00_23480 [Citrobacter sedlakii]|uniref:hypothetical protein n=1 Tax=Citrobacter sedlakii TaxID=67826 RepID=UPI0022B40E9A|nr:hypothetical protein [Citrobacter sedlakii]MCZ4677298.1 hypothetical protein [Citrobacter sedlakii]MDR5007355.1 hypothetical protein [Citrobacter sedlakii]